MRGGIVDTTTSQQTRDNRGSGEGHVNCDGDKKCPATAVAGFGDDDHNDNCQRPRGG